MHGSASQPLFDTRGLASSDDESVSVATSRPDPLTATWASEGGLMLGRGRTPKTPPMPKLSRRAVSVVTPFSPLNTRRGVSVIEDAVEAKDVLTEKQKQQGVFQGMISGSLKKKIDTLNKQVEALDKAVVDMQQSIDNIVKTLDEQQQGMNDDIQTLSQSVGSLATQQEQAGLRMDELEAFATETRRILAEEVALLGKSSNKTQESFSASIRERLSKLEQDLGKASASTSSNEAAITNLLNRVEGAEHKQVESSSALTNALAAALDELRSTDIRPLASKTDVRKEVSPIETALEEQLAMISQIDTQMSGVCQLSGVNKDQLAALAEEAGKNGGVLPVPEEDSDKKSKGKKRKEKEKDARRKSGVAVGDASSNVAGMSGSAAAIVAPTPGLGLLAAVREETEADSSDEEIPPTLQTQVDVIMRAMVEKADADDVEEIRGLVAGMQGRLDDQERSLVEKLDRTQVQEVRAGIDENMVAFENRLNEVREDMNKRASPEDLHRLNESTSRCRKEVSILQENMKEKISHTQLRPWVDALKNIRTQLSNVRDDVQSKADNVSMLSKLDNLQLSQTQLAKGLNSITAAGGSSLEGGTIPRPSSPSAEKLHRKGSRSSNDGASPKMLTRKASRANLEGKKR